MGAIRIGRGVTREQACEASAAILRAPAMMTTLRAASHVA